MNADYGLTAHKNKKNDFGSYYERLMTGKIVWNPETQQTPEDRAYDDYQVAWMKEHGFTNRDFLDKTAKISKKMFSETRQPSEHMDVYARFLKEGFNGQIWDSKEVFLEKMKEKSEIGLEM